MMKKTLLSFILVFAVLVGYSQTLPYQKSKIRVKFTESSVPVVEKQQAKRGIGTVSTGLQKVDILNTSNKAIRMERVFPYNAKYDQRHRAHGLHLWYEITFDASIEVGSIVKAYSNLEEVQVAELLYNKELIPYKINKYTPKRDDVQMPFNDPYLPDQWHYNNRGQSLNETDFANNLWQGADINLFDGWLKTAGTPNVIVSVHDQGIDVTHEDLAANMWVNEAEYNGEEGVDDDFNGYIDDIHGYNFRKNTGKLDAEDHGSHVAGTIAAVNNNEVGVAGVAGGSGNNDGVRLMSLEIFGEANIARTYIYAADNGAVISQNSWGYTSPDYYEQSILDAIDYFIDEAGNYPGSPMRGGVVIFAAGNSAWEFASYPAYYERVVAVAATGPENKITTYSNYGDWVDISAPGGEQGYGSKSSVLSTLPQNDYGYMDGTSMACPHVSGVAALIASLYGGEGFTNETLLAHLLTGTRSIDEVNDPYYTAKLGIGIADVVLALKKNEGVPPLKISNLAENGVSQDFIKLKWTVPTDIDDERPSAFQVYFHSQPITEENIQLAESFTITNKALAGTEVESEISNLSPVTTYYVAVRSFDRWANRSEISNILQVTTNQGPEINLAPEELIFDIDASVNATANAIFSITNDAEGVLRWNATLRHKNTSISANRNSVKFPVIATYSVDKEWNVDGYNLNNTKEKSGKRFETISKSYGMGWGTQIIGDVDTDYPNSAATRFYVDEENGFNLTQVTMWLKHDQNLGPVIMEIYKGYDLMDNNLMLVQEHNNYSADYASYAYITLDEQLYFEQGDYFWVVFHVPAGNLYCLGAEEAVDYENTKNCLMSNDLGKTWEILEDKYLEGAVWATVAISNNENIAYYLNPSPSNDEIEGFGNQQVEVNVDASTLINGTYEGSIVIQSNDNDEKYSRIPVTVNVSGHKPVIVTDQIINMGNTLLGSTITTDVVVKNTGLGKFQSVTVTSSNPEIELEGYAPWNIAAKTETTLKFKYTPEGVGSDNASITLTDGDGNKYSFNLYAVAAAPPQITVSPAESWHNNVTIGDEYNGTFTITNDGAYPLKYFISGFGDENAVGQVDASIHRFGYYYDVNTYEPQNMPWEDISADGIDVTNLFLSVDRFSEHKQIDIGFKFPFFGQRNEQIYLTRRGILAFDDNSTYNVSPSRPLDRNKYNPNGYISAFGDALNPMEGGNIYYKHLPGKLIIQYQNVALPYSQGVSITFQIILTDNGNIRMAYKDVDNIPDWQKEYFVVAIENYEQTDALAYTYPSWDNPDVVQPINNGYVIDFVNPGMGGITQVSNTSGIVQVGESKVIDYTVGTTDLYEGVFTEIISIISNDPFNNPVTHKIHFDINSGGVDAVTQSTSEIAFGDVMQYATVKQRFNINNSGTKQVTFNFATQNGKFLLSQTQQITLNAGQMLYIDAAPITATKGLLTDKVIITASNGQTYEIQLNANIVDAPQIAVNVSSIDQTLEHGQTATLSVTVTNNGTAPLVVSPVFSDWLYSATTQPTSTALGDVSYSFISTKSQTNATFFRWDNVKETGTHNDKITVLNDWYPEEDGYEKWLKIEFPFEFDFYGNKYNHIWVTDIGLATFDRYDDIEVFGDLTFGNPDMPNNIIAPLWLAGGMAPSFPGEKGYGFYYRATEEFVVIQWEDMYHMTGMGDRLDMQIILFKNGNIKFQYIQPTNDGTSHFGVAGIENADASDFVQIFAYQSYLKGNTAILLRPEVKRTIAAGESFTYQLTVDAKNINAGVFNNPLIFKSNDPVNATLSIPAQLTVNGVAELQAPSAFEFGEIMAIETEEYPYFESYSIEKSLKNVGSAPLTVNSILVENLPASTTVEAYAQTFDWVGNPTVAWTNINWLSFPISVEGGSTLPVRITMMPSATEIGLVNGSISFDTNNPTSTDATVVAISATIIAPPALNVTNKNLEVFTNSNAHTEIKSFTIDNLSGNSTLEYQISLNFVRKGEVEQEAEEPPPFIESVSTLKVQTMQTIGKRSALKRDDYNRVLENDTQSESSTKLGFGQSRGLEVGTAFTAPADGFNLSHVKTWYVPGDWKKSEINVKIYAGDKIKNSILLADQKFQHTITTGDEVGSYITFELAEPIKLFPNEHFFVVIRYPLGAEYPQGAALFEETLENTFFYKIEENDEFAWIPLERELPDYGWMVKAMEKEVNGKYWVSLDASPEGQLAVGEILTVNVNFDAQYAEAGLQTAYAYVHANDPYLPKDSVRLALYRNQPPAFKQVEGENKVLETETTKFNILVEDPDGDTFTVKLKNTYPNTTFGGANGVYTFSYTPDYEAKGITSFELVAEDKYGFTNSFTFYVKVYDKNRMPVATAVSNRTYFEGDNYETIATQTVFTDADADVLQFTSQSSNTHVAQVIYYNGRFNILPAAVGTTVITLTATDKRSAEVITTFNITVNPEPNAAPQAGSIANRVYDVYANIDYLPLSALFTDNEGDALIYTLNVADASVVTILKTNDVLSIDPLKVGSTLVTITATDGKSTPVSATFTISVYNFTGIEENNQTEVKIYPNPVSSYAYIQFDAATTEKPLIRLFDTNGRLIIEERAENANSHIIDTQALSKGVYFIHIEVNSQTIAVKKLIKQ